MTSQKLLICRGRQKFYNVSTMLDKPGGLTPSDLIWVKLQVITPLYSRPFLQESSICELMVQHRWSPRSTFTMSSHVCTPLLIFCQCPTVSVPPQHSIFFSFLTSTLISDPILTALTSSVRTWRKGDTLSYVFDYGKKFENQLVSHLGNGGGNRHIPPSCCLIS